MGKMASFFKICECCYPWKCPLASLHVRGICVYVFVCVLVRICVRCSCLMCVLALGDLILKWCVSNPAVARQEVQLKLRHPPRAPGSSHAVLRRFGCDELRRYVGYEAVAWLGGANLVLESALRPWWHRHVRSG